MSRVHEPSGLGIAADASAPGGDTREVSVQSRDLGVGRVDQELLGIGDARRVQKALGHDRQRRGRVDQLGFDTRAAEGIHRLETFGLLRHGERTKHDGLFLLIIRRLLRHGGSGLAERTRNSREADDGGVYDAR